MNSANFETPQWFTDALAVPCEEGSVEVDGCSIAFRRWGDHADPGVVLVHGRGAHSRWWDHIAPLIAEGRCVTALDLSGNGDSGWRPKYGWDVWARDVTGVATEASESSVPPVIIGHSMGGRSTLIAAAAAGRDFRGVVLIDVAMGPTWASGQALRPNFVPRPHRISATEEEIVDRFRLWPEQPAVLPYVFDHVARTSYRKVPGGFTWKSDPQTTDRGDPISDDILKNIVCDFALIRCENGRMAPRPGAWFESMIGRAVPVIDLPLAFHSAMFDEPLSLVTALRAVLSQWGHRAPYE